MSPLTSDRHQLASRIYERAHLTGSFVLRSGATSSEYFDKYLFESDPRLLRDVAQALAGLLPEDVDTLAGLELGGVPLAAVCSQLSGLPTLFVRKEAKSYGTCRLAEGGPVAGRRLAVIEDVVTSGGQVVESCRQLRAEDASFLDLVEAVRALPYGRPSDRTVEGMLRERRGTCSTKHLFLAKVLAERFPETEPQIVHRVYTLDRARAQECFGAEVAEAIPDTDLVDIHRYITVVLNGQRVEIDATFPGTAWDGHSFLPLACGPGEDYPASDDPDMEKRALEEKYCDPTVREPFIVALTRADSLSAYPPRPDGHGD